MKNHKSVTIHFGCSEPALEFLSQETISCNLISMNIEPADAKTSRLQIEK